MRSSKFLVHSSIACLALVALETSATSTAAFAHEAKMGPLHGTISLDESPDPITKCINNLTDAAVVQDKDLNEIDKYVERFKGFKHSLVRRSKDALNYVFLYKGVAQSSEASDVILDEKQKLNGRSSAEYLRQKLLDRLNISVTEAVLELAQGLGDSDPQQGAEVVQAATSKLKTLVGDEKAQETVSFLNEMLKQNPVGDDVWMQKQWSIGQKSERQNYLVDLSVATDPVTQQLVGYLHKYNHVSALNRGSQRIVRASLGIASLSPTLVAPAAQAALFAWVMASGGSEEDKLLKEVYMGKTLAIRSKAVGDKAHLALDYYQVALLTRNPVLLQCCRSMIKQMAGDNNASSVLAAGKLVCQQPLKEEISLSDEKADKDKAAKKEKKSKRKHMKAETASTVDTETK